MSEWIHTANVSFFFATLGGHMAIKWESRVGPETGWIAQRPYRVSGEALPRRKSPMAYPHNGTMHVIPEDVQVMVMKDFDTIRHMVPNIRKLVLAEYREAIRIQNLTEEEYTQELKEKYRNAASSHKTDS